MKSDVEIGVCVCVWEQDETLQQIYPHGMYGMWWFITVGSYLVGSQIIKAASDKVFVVV